MKRDPELIRQILFEVQQCSANEYINKLNFQEYDQYTIARHVELLIEASLVDGTVEHYVSGEPPSIHIKDLTWFGHDFIDAVQDDTIWEKVKDNVLKPTASWTFGLVLEYAISEIKSRIGL